MKTNKMKFIAGCLISISLVLFTFKVTNGQNDNEIKIKGIYTQVDFKDSVNYWDGFGVNYVETAQTRDYVNNPEDYGGFSTLTEKDRRELLELIFGNDGLKPSLLKMFLDPYHEGLTKKQSDNNDPYNINMQGYDHTTTTKWMRFFAHEGLKMTRQQGRDLQIITTLYGPAPWMTKQRFVRGRDLDPNEKFELAEYMISWVKYLIETEELPVKYLSIHNEGENNDRWDAEGKTAGIPYHDHNLWWHKEQITDFLKILPPMLKQQDIESVGITPGECVSYTSMLEQDIPQAITIDKNVLKNMDLFTTHSFSTRGPFVNSMMKKAYQIHCKKNLKIWTTSFSFINMNVDFLWNIHHEIYSAETNGLIMWAPIQMKDKWIDGEPNRGCAIWVENGKYIVRDGYYYLKSIMRAGMAGMNVVKTISADNKVKLTAFAKANTNHTNAFNIINTNELEDLQTSIVIKGSNSKKFKAYRTSPTENYVYIGEFTVENGVIYYTTPKKSSTTFFEIN